MDDSTCCIKGCQDDKIYGLVRAGRLYRLSFSKSLLQHVREGLPEAYTLARFKVYKGRILERGEESSSGLYGIESHKGKLLRIALSKDVADMLCDWRFRKLREIRLTAER